MKRTVPGVAICAIACTVFSTIARSAAPAIHIEDVERFYQVYDAAGGHPTAEQLQRDYLDRGSEGLHQLAKVRNVTGARIADTLAKRPEIYSGAKRCLTVLPRVRQRVEVALRELIRVYPQAVLVRSLTEGAAEFVAELTSGRTGFAHFAALTQGREQEIETAFAADIDKTDLSDWADNSTFEKAGDLGYWVGYRIVRSYYQRAADKKLAVKEILELSDPKAFLEKSGWQPGAAGAP